MSETSIDVLALVESSPQELQRAKEFYEAQASRATPSTKATIEYALALVRSGKVELTEKGFSLLRELWHRSVDEEVKRLCVVYAIIGYYKLGRFQQAQEYAQQLFMVRPRDRDGKRLVQLIDEAQKRETVQTAAVIAGGGALAAGLIAGLVFGVSRLMRR